MNRINPKESQNFITSKKLIHDILSRTNIGKKDLIFEIGSGKGHFTRELVKKCQFLTAVEIDSKLVSKTQESINHYENVQVIHADILNYKFPQENQSYKVFGNIPYNISTKIIKKLVFKSSAKDCFLIVEKGFAKRLVDHQRALGLLIYPEVDVKVMKSLPQECFHPKPKVDSVLIRLKRKEYGLHSIDQELYQRFVYKLVNKEYRKLFTKQQFKQALKHAQVTNIHRLSGDQVLSMFHSYKLFKN